MSHRHTQCLSQQQGQSGSFVSQGARWRLGSWAAPGPSQKEGVPSWSQVRDRRAPVRQGCAPVLKLEAQEGRGWRRVKGKGATPQSPARQEASLELVWSEGFITPSPLTPTSVLSLGAAGSTTVETCLRGRGFCKRFLQHGLQRSQSPAIRTFCLF